jgi:hypothetical protein
MFALALSTIQGLIGFHAILYFDKYPHVMAALIEQHTSKSDKLVIQGGGFGGELLFLSNRKGLTVFDTKLLEDKQTCTHLKELGFTKLVMVSESPLLAAIKHNIRTSPTVDRESYRLFATPIVDGWPTVIQTEDILIKELP